MKWIKIQIFISIKIKLLLKSINTHSFKIATDVSASRPTYQNERKGKKKNQMILKNYIQKTGKESWKIRKNLLFEDLQYQKN